MYSKYSKITLNKYKSQYNKYKYKVVGFIIFRFAFANFYNSDDLSLMSQNDADNFLSHFLSRHTDNFVTLLDLHLQISRIPRIYTDVT